MVIKKIVNSVFASNTYILIDPKCEFCWLIDVGDIDSILEFIGNRCIKGVFLTHTHYDHIYGIPDLLEKFPECMIYTSVDGKEGLASDKFNLSRYHVDPICYDGNNVEILEDFSSVQLFEGINLYSILTPGHDMSSVTYYTDEHIFTGDSYIPGIAVVTTFPRSNKADSKVSLEKIQALLTTRIVYPGHQ